MTGRKKAEVITVDAQGTSVIIFGSNEFLEPRFKQGAARDGIKQSARDGTVYFVFRAGPAGAEAEIIISIGSIHGNDDVSTSRRNTLLGDLKKLFEKHQLPFVIVQ